MISNPGLTCPILSVVTCNNVIFILMLIPANNRLEPRTENSVENYTVGLKT